MEAQAPNTFLHSWNWGEFHKKLGYKIFRLGISKKNGLIAVALFIKIPARRGTFLFCPHGPIFKARSLEERKTDIKKFLSEGKLIARKENCSFVRVSPLMEAADDNEKLFLSLGFRNAPTHMHAERSWILDLRPSEEELLKSMRKTTRYSIRKAQRDGVRIIQSDNPKHSLRFFPLYGTTVDRQRFTPFSEQYLTTEFEVFRKDGQAMWFFAKYNREIVSGAMVIKSNGSAFYHHGASSQKYPSVPASALLQWEAIREAKKSGLKRYNFWGIAPENEPNHPWAGITLFKQGFGGYAETYVHAKDYVLSPRYWITYFIEKIRREKRGL